MGVGIKGGDSGDALQDGGGFFPGGRESLAVAAPGREELHQDDSLRAQNLPSMRPALSAIPIKGTPIHDPKKGK